MYAALLALSLVAKPTVLTYEDVTYKLGKPDQETPAGDTGLVLLYKRGKCVLIFTTDNDVVTKQSKICVK